MVNQLGTHTLKPLLQTLYALYQLGRRQSSIATDKDKFGMV